MRLAYSAFAWSFLSVLAVSSLAALGCDGSEPPSLESYFATTPYANGACNAVDGQLAGQRQMRLYVATGVSLLPVTQGIANYYQRHSLSFFTESQPERTTMSYALDTDLTALNRALKAEFPGVDLSNEYALMVSDPALYNQVVTFVANFVLKPMIDFAKGHSEAGGAVTNLILVPDLERPGGQSIGAPGTSLAGLAISPALLAEFDRTMTDDAMLWQGVALPDGFSPMMVLGNSVLAQARKLDPELDDLVAAHEFGHTGALIHSNVERNLMYPNVTPGFDDCTDPLDDAQLATMRTAYGLGTLASDAPLANRAAATPSTGPSRIGAAFPPERLRALLAGEPGAMRSFVERLFHGSAAL